VSEASRRVSGASRGHVGRASEASRGHVGQAAGGAPGRRVGRVWGVETRRVSDGSGGAETSAGNAERRVPVAFSPKSERRGAYSAISASSRARCSGIM